VNIFEDINYKQINLNEIKVLWDNDWYDGPLCGILLYDNNKYYYHVDQENNSLVDKSWYRLFFIYKLTPEQVIKEEERQKCFRENVNSYHDYTVEDKLVQPQEKWSIYYSRYDDENYSEEYMKNEIIGYFID
jgi:hypothetical protein